MQTNYIAAAILIGVFFVCGRLIPLYFEQKISTQDQYDLTADSKNRIEGKSKVIIGVQAQKSSVTIRAAAKLASTAKEASNIISEKVKNFEEYLEQLKTKGSSVDFEVENLNITSNVLKLKDKYTKQYVGSQRIKVNASSTDILEEVIKKASSLGLFAPTSIQSEIDDRIRYQRLARKWAIKYAKADANSIAKDIGASLGRVTGFQEGVNSYQLFGRGSDLVEVQYIYVDQDGNEKEVVELPEKVETVPYFAKISYGTK